MFMVEIEKLEEKRKTERIRFQEALEFQWKNTPIQGGCLACDLSEGGIKINFNEFVPLNSEIELTLRLKGQPDVLMLLGRVAWVKQVPFSDRYQLGLEFSGSDPNSIAETNREICHYIKSHRL